MGTFEAQTGFAKGTPIRLSDTGSIPFIQKRPAVDIKTLSAKASNEIIDILVKYREQQAKASKTFLKRKPAKPTIDLEVVVDSLKEAVETEYRVSAARCEPAMLELDENHLLEIEQLQAKAMEDFCRQVLRAVRGDATLEEQVYNLSPALRPLPEPDKAALAVLQRQADKIMAAAMSKHEDLIDTLRELDALVREEASFLAETSEAGNGRIQRQAVHVKAELIRLLEQQEVAKSLRIPVGRW
jgi:DNA-directed RNA polymerase beta subunit